ncbi:MAG: Type 1 glutamine amidotransferase-like domain-containing protein [Acidimicrobiales bacterium]
MTSGTLALVGGGEFSEGCTFDQALLDAGGGDEVLILPTGAAYEPPERLVGRAEKWFAGMGGRARSLDVLRRPDALDPDHADAARSARFIYLAGESPMHMRSVLKDSPVWEAIVEAWHGGAVLAGSGAGAMVLCDPMVDPRGGAFTVGLGLLANIGIIPEFDTWSDDAIHRTRRLSPEGLILVGVPRRTALLRDPDGGWRADGEGEVSVFRDGGQAGLDALT